MTDRIKAAIYARVSTENMGQDPMNQVIPLRELAAREGMDLSPEREFIDRETGTGKRRRPEYERMIYQAEQKRYAVLLIWSLDRLSREGTLKTLLLLERLSACGVKVRSLQEPWLNPESPTYELLLPIFSWIARQEAIRCSSRVREGLRRARMQGQVLGRPRAVVDVEQVKEVYASTHSVRLTAKATGLSRALVHRTLKRNADAPALVTV